jgi:hypothetical protein
MELESMYLISAILLFLAGPGRYAIDRYGSEADRDSGAPIPLDNSATWR